MKKILLSAALLLFTSVLATPDTKMSVDQIEEAFNAVEDKLIERLEPIAEELDDADQDIEKVKAVITKYGLQEEVFKERLAVFNKELNLHSEILKNSEISATTQLFDWSTGEAFANSFLNFAPFNVVFNLKSQLKPSKLTESLPISHVNVNVNFGNFFPATGFQEKENQLNAELSINAGMDSFKIVKKYLTSEELDAACLPEMKDMLIQLQYEATGLASRGVTVEDLTTIVNSVCGLNALVKTEKAKDFNTFVASATPLIKSLNTALKAPLDSAKKDFSGFIARFVVKDEFQAAVKRSFEAYSSFAINSNDCSSAEGDCTPSIDLTVDAVLGLGNAVASFKMESNQVDLSIKGDIHPAISSLDDGDRTEIYAYSYLGFKKIEIATDTDLRTMAQFAAITIEDLYKDLAEFLGEDIDALEEPTEIIDRLD